jgi:hypothetical protein
MAGGGAGGQGTRGAGGQRSRAPPLSPRLKMTPAVGPTLSVVEEEMNEMRQGQNCPFTCAEEGMCKRNF